MKRRAIYLLIGMREFSLVFYLLMSLAMCYMLAECMIPIIQYFWNVDLVLTQHEYEICYMLPNIVLLIILFVMIRKLDKISFELLIPLQILFYCVFHILILLLAGDSLSIYWFPWGNYPLPIYEYYHTGLRNHYTDIAYYLPKFYGAIEIWIRFGVVLLLFVSLAMLYRFLKVYIIRKTQSAPFAIPEMSEKSQE